MFRWCCLYFSSNSLRSADGSTSIRRIFVAFRSSDLYKLAPVNRTNSASSKRVKTRWNELQSMRKVTDEWNNVRASDCRARCMVEIVPSPWISKGVSSMISLRNKHSSIHRMETMKICRATAWKIFFDKVHWKGTIESSTSKCVVDELTLRLFESETHEENCLMKNSNCCYVQKERERENVEDGNQMVFYPLFIL